MTIVITPIPAAVAYTSLMGRDAFLARYPWLKRAVVSEPLIGLVNGNNKRFRLGSPPALNGSVSVINMAGAAITTASIDEESGSLVVTTAPTSTLFASYTHSVYTETELTGFFIAGYDHMESLWPRGYYLVESSGVYHLSSASDSIVDPVISTGAFSERPAQYNLLVGCMAYQWAMSAWGEAAAHGIMTREKLAVGIQIDRTRQPASLRDLVKEWSLVIDRLLEVAMIDFGASAGAFDVVPAYQDLMPNVFAPSLAFSEPV